MTANFSHDFHFFKLGVSATGNYTFESKFQSNAFTSAALPNAGLDRECVGYYSVNCSFTGSLQPKWQTADRSTLGFDFFDISLLWRHIDAFNQEPDDVANGNGPAFSGMITDPKLANSGIFGQNVNFGHIKPYDYFDLSTRIAVMENLSLTITAQNIGNRKPPIVGSTIGSTAFNSGNTYPSTYDALGRRYAVTARVKF